MVFSRKAEAAGAAATLVIVIALLLVLYVLLLPPDTRAGLLGEEVSSSPSGEREAVVFASFVPSAPAAEAGVEVRPLPIFTLRTDVAGNVLASRSSVVVRRSVFDSSEEVIRFTAPANTNNALLSFSVAQAQGSLEVLLNGEVIHSGVVERRQPVPLSLGSLSGDNELVFRLSGVGFSFWSTHMYDLRDVQVTGDVAYFERASQAQRFIVQDPSSIQAAVLSFVPDCYQEGGRMEVVHNSALIYSGFPLCGVPLEIDLAPSQLSEIENRLVFSIESGEYLIDQAEIVYYREPAESKGEFSLTQQQLTDIRSRGSEVMLGLSFEQAGAEGRVVVNGQPLD